MFTFKVKFMLRNVIVPSYTYIYFIVSQIKKKYVDAGVKSIQSEKGKSSLKVAGGIC